MSEGPSAKTKDTNNFNIVVKNEGANYENCLDLKNSGRKSIKQELVSEDENGNTLEELYDATNWKIKTEEIEIKSDVELETIQEILERKSEKPEILARKKKERLAKQIRLNFVDHLDDLELNIKKVTKSAKTQKINDNARNLVKNHIIKPKYKGVVRNAKYRCFDCPFTTNHRESIKMHNNTHKPLLEVGYRCAKCEYITRYKMSLKNHLKIHLSPDKLKLLDVHKCPTCNYATREKGNLRRHMKKHKNKEEVKMFSCKECKFETKYGENLKRHASVHKPLRNFGCTLCNFRTPHKERLMSHMVIHKNKSHVLQNCKHCSFQTFHSGNLMLHYKKEHETVAKRILKFSCKVCQFKTSNKQNLNNHNYKYHSDKIFVCKYCPYKTVYRQNLKKHHLNHSSTEKKPNDIILKCKWCTFETPTKLSLWSHELAHKKSPKLINCQFCSYQTLHGAGLQKHYLNKHNGWISTNKELYVKIVPWKK